MRTSKCVVATLAATGLALTGCTSGGGAASDPNAAGTSDANGCSQASLIAEMPIKSRLSQMLMGGVFADQGESAIRSAIDAVAKDWVGGVNFLGSTSYAYSENQLAEAVDAGGQIPPFLAVDEEGGRVQRMSEIVGIRPSARVMGDTMTPEQVRKEGKEIGTAMSKVSLNMDLAPVVDVSDQDDYDVVGDRSFSDDPEEVTEYAGAFADGLRDADVIPVLKHFPGLGSATGNTDFEAASTPPLSQLKKKDLIPYESLLLEEPVAVMLSNATVPGLTGTKPATLSPAAYELLRDDYGFTGVAMTDSLSAAAITGDTPVTKAAVAAIVAGADVALWDGITESKSIRRQLIRAVRKDRLPESQVNASVERILDLKGVDLCEGR